LLELEETAEELEETAEELEELEETAEELVLELVTGDTGAVTLLEDEDEAVVVELPQTPLKMVVTPE